MSRTRIMFHVTIPHLSVHQLDILVCKLVTNSSGQTVLHKYLYMHYNCSLRERLESLQSKSRDPSEHRHDDGGRRFDCAMASLV